MARKTDGQRLVKTKTTEPENFYEAVYRVVRKIPKGRVMPYGQPATILATLRAAGAVGPAASGPAPSPRCCASTPTARESPAASAITPT